MTYLPNIAIRYTHPALKNQAIQIASDLNIAIASPDYQGWLLVVEHTQISLRHSQENYHITISFSSGKNAHRRTYGGGRQQAISKAVGLDKPRCLHILDTTAGYGKDAFVFATLGAQVTLLERSPILALLLRDALYRSGLQADVFAITQQMQLIHTDAIAWLSSPQDNYDVIYLDPMYPERQKSALVKKEMRVAKALVGDDLDAPALLALALDQAIYRVVVKRPKTAKSLQGPSASLTISSKNTRYDIYTKQKLD